MFKHIFMIAVTSLLVSCGIYPSKPIEKQEFPVATTPKKHLLVLLSGRGASLDYFETHHWVEIAQQFTDDYDFVAPYAHYGYYMTRQLIPRLREDIILPARKAGYATISLAGISMGGLGALLYSERYPEDVDRLYLFAPFLGNDDVLQQIRDDGGLTHWQLREADRDDWNYSLWNWIAQLTTDPQKRAKLFLGYGDNDRLKGHDLLAQSLISDHVVNIAGRHDDDTFARLWEIMLSRGFLRHSDDQVLSSTGDIGAK